MYDAVTEALERRDYRAAARQLKPLLKDSSEDPWLRFYAAQVYEGMGKTDKAEQLYLRLLRSATQRRIISGARQGIQRIKEGERAERQAAIAQATVESGRTALGGLVLEPLLPEQKQRVVPAFARMMQLDEYAARLLLPSRGWRFYRTGKIGELEVYANQLQQIGVPVFCQALEDLAAVPIFQTQQLQFRGDRITAVPLQTQPLNQKTEKTETPGEPPLQFFSKQIRLCLEGALPMFESVVDVDKLKKNPFVRRQQVKDYAKVLDLHLPGQIVRLCDRTYSFPAGKALEDRYASIPQKWRKLLKQLSNLRGADLRGADLRGADLQPADLSSAPNREIGSSSIIGSEQFKNFASTVIDQEDFLRRIPPNLDLSKADALIFYDDAPPWHEAFQLYSTLWFRRDSP